MADLEAGRELDERVAVEVMGWGWMTSHAEHTQILPFKRWLVPPAEIGDWGHVHPADLALPKEEPWWLDDQRRLPLGLARVPHFSTDIAAAWTVVEKLIAEHFSPDLIHGGAPDSWWECCIDHYTDLLLAHDPWPVSRRAATAPLAICLAALDAFAALSAQGGER